MKTLVKITAICTLVLLTLSANAQMRFGVKAGLSMAKQSFDPEMEGTDLKMKMGFHIGAIADFSFGESFSFQPGLIFNQKGVKGEASYTDEDGIDIKESGSYNFNYLDIPLNLIYKIDAGDMKFFLSAGPSISYALSGKSKNKMEAMGISLETEEDIKFEDNGYKRLDFGLGFGAGLEFGKIQAGVSYNLGLANIVDSDDSTIKNNVIGISVAYLFGE